MKDEAAVRAAMLQAQRWGAYAAVMETLRRGEKLAFERWGRAEGGMATAVDEAEIRAMEHLRMGLEALWAGFGDE